MSGLLSGWRPRFQKRINVLPFLRLNVSRHGVSGTLHERVGPVNLSYNPKTRTQTVSLVGTGLRWTRKAPARTHNRYEKWTDGRLD